MNYKNIDAEDFEACIRENPDAVVLDVRTPPEYAEGHIPGSILIDIMSIDFREQIDKLDKHKSYYLYCRSGVRSENACAYMANKGFAELYNLSTGIIGWNGSINK